MNFYLPFDVHEFERTIPRDNIIVITKRQRITLSLISKQLKYYVVVGTYAYYKVHNLIISYRTNQDR